MEKKQQNQTNERQTHLHSQFNEDSQTLRGNFTDSSLKFRIFDQNHHYFTFPPPFYPIFSSLSVKENKSLVGFLLFSLFYTEYRNKSLCGEGSFLLLVSSERQGWKFLKMQTRYMDRSNSMAAAPAREKRGLDSSTGGDEGQPERKRPALAR
jgi:hypothetical protein